jgi:hypothetical protein
MPLEPVNPLNVKGQIRASALRKLAGQSFGSTQIRGSGDVGGFSSQESFQLTDLTPKKKWLQLTSNTGDAYGWTEQMDDGAGNPIPIPNAFEGTATSIPAYEINGVTTVPVDTYVWAEPADDGMSLLFIDPAGGVPTRKLRGTLTGILSFGGSTTMTVAVTGATLTVYDWLLSSGQTVASGLQVTVFLDNNGNWYVDGAQCP